MIRFCVDHPIVSGMIFAALIVCGAYAVPRLDIEAMPETDLPSLTVQTAWLGASPTAIQQSLTVPIEEAVRRVYGVEKIVARSYPGRSQVEVSFRRGVDLDFARLQLNEQLGAVRRDLPATAGQPSIVPYLPDEFRTDDFFTVSLISPLPANELRDEADNWLLPRLLALPGVADAELQGGAGALVRVYLDLERMERYGLTADRVYQRLAELDEIVPAGAVRRAGQEFTVSVRDAVTLDRLRRVVLRYSGGQAITLDHIGRVEPGYEDPAYFVRINGENVIQATVAKRSGENAIAISRRLRSALPEIASSMPFPVSFEIDEDQGRDLEEKLEELVYRSLIILGLLFLLLAITLRQVVLTAVVISSILMAVVICLSLFYFLGISVNFITISGLTVCFGMLLNNSILVLDAIHRRLTAPAPVSGKVDARAALIEGAREVAFPIAGTTLTTVVAFLSFSMLSGRFSLYYRPLAASVGLAMTASILIGLTWIPVTLRGPAARIAERSTTHPSAHRRIAGWKGFALWLWVTLGLAVVTAAVYFALEGPRRLLEQWPWALGLFAFVMAVAYVANYIERLTAFVLRISWAPIVLFLLLCAGGAYLFKHEIHQGGFWQQENEEELTVYIERPVGTDVVLSHETIKLFEAEMTPLPAGVHTKSWSWENRAVLRVRFSAERLLSEYPELFRNRAILLAEELGGMTIYIGGFGDPYFKGGLGGGLSNSLIKLTGYNSRTLDSTCKGIMARLARNRRVRNVRLTSGEQFERAAADETVIVIHRDRLRAHHLSMLEVAAHLRRLLGVEIPWHMLVEGEDQRLQLALEDAADIQYDQIMQKSVTTARGERVRLGDLISLEVRPVVGSIHRENQRYAMQINWEYIGTDRMRQAYVNEILDGLALPYGYSAEDVSGERITEEEQEEVQTVLWLTVAFIFLTLAVLFESVTLPILVMIAVPMALIGVVAIFWLTDTSFDSSAKIGLVLLFGIVVNNAILFLNRFRIDLREIVARRPDLAPLLPDVPRLGGSDLWRLPGETRKEVLREAIVRAMRIQLDSVLLTTGTTIAGLLPLLVQISDQTEGKDIWENLALSSIGGLASSTLLLIVAFPAMYWISAKAGWMAQSTLERWKRRARTEAEAVPASPGPGAE